LAEATEADRGAQNASPFISYFRTKTFDKTLQNAFLLGGQTQKRGDKVRIVLGSLEDHNPFASLPVTKHGETRIKNCVKYELGDAWRLVTRQTDKTCTFLFVGDHEDTEKWIEGHKGESVGVKDRRLIRLPGVGNDPAKRPLSVDHQTGTLVDMLDEDSVDHLLDGLSPKLVRRFASLDGSDSIREIEAILARG
jgi:hypothetical protein